MKGIRSFALVLAGALLVGLAVVSPASAQGPGALDGALDFDGKAYSPREFGSVGGMVIQASGKIVVAGAASQPNTDQRVSALVRHNADGSVDTSFGTDGIVLVPFDALYGGFVTDVALQSDGKIVAVGNTGSGGELLRLSVDGLPDPAFGTGGKVVTAGVELESVLVEPDGDVVVAGSDVTSKKDLLIARYTTSGVLDPSFAGDGIAVVPVSPKSDEAFAVGRLSDGSIVAAGQATGVDNVDFAVVRVSDTGVPVPTFGGDGIVTTPIGASQDRAYALAVQSDDKIVVGGRSIGVAGNDFALARYLPDGSLDPGFGTDGMVTTDVLGRYEAIEELVVRDDGRIVAAGGAYDAEEPMRRAVLTYSATGSLDPAFGDGGVAAGLRGSGAAEGLAIDADGRILVATAIWDSLKGFRWVLSRLTDSPSPDTATTLKAVAPAKVGLRDRFVVRGKLISADPACQAKQEIALGFPYPELRRDTASDGSFRFKLRADRFRWRDRMFITLEYEGTSACGPPDPLLLRVRLVKG